jgi:hypothetical protein
LPALVRGIEAAEKVCDDPVGFRFHSDVVSDAASPG